MSIGGACNQNIEEFHKENSTNTIQTFEEKKVNESKVVCNIAHCNNASDSCGSGRWGQ
jgi:hypothetical protein